MNSKDIGSYLKSIREEKGLTLEEVSQATKIKVRFLQYIEDNNFKEIGGVGYAKAMSYTYARFLDANLDEVIAILNKKFPETVLQDFDKEPEPMPKRYFFSTSVIPILIVIIFAVIFTIVIIKNKNTQIKPKIKTEKIFKKSRKEQKINTEILKDTTDYLNKYLFKNKKHPFKSNE